MQQHLKNVIVGFSATIFLFIFCKLPEDPSRNPALATVTLKTDSTITVINGVYTDTIGSKISFTLMKHFPHLVSACTLLMDTDTSFSFPPDSFPEDIPVSYSFFTPGVKLILASITRVDGSVYRDSLIFNINGFKINITRQPESIMDTVGNEAVLSILTTGSQPITYQWFKGETPIDSAKSHSLVFKALKKTDDGTYYCSITNPMGTVNCSTVTITAIIPNTPPMFIDSFPENSYTTFDDTSFVFKILATDNDTDSVFYCIGSSNLPSLCTVIFLEDSIQTITLQNDTSYNHFLWVTCSIPENVHGTFNLILGATDKEDTTFKAVQIIVVDRTAPEPVVIIGKTPTNTARPAWMWNNVNGGNGTFRMQLDNDIFADSIKVVSDTLFTPVSDLAEGVHVLYVQAGDGAGNWSSTSSFGILIDAKKPSAPEVTGSAVVTNNPKPTWSWNGDESVIGYRYKVNSSILTTGATETIENKYIPSENLRDTTYTLYVQARDESGNWSDAGYFSIFVDSKAPVAPTVTGTARTTSTTPMWTWIPNGGGKNLFRCNLNSEQFDSSSFVTNALTYLATSSLAEGTYTLYVQEQDSAGNWSSSGSFTTIIDTTAPAAPTVSGNSPTNTLTPQWKWDKPFQSNGLFRYKLDSEDLSSGAATTIDTFYVPVLALTPGSHVLYVQTRDETGNWSRSGFSVITIDTLAPTAPVVRGNSLVNIQKPVWHWTVPFDANKSRCKLNSNDFSSGATEITDTMFIPEANLSEGPQTLFVQVRDAAGNWSISNSFQTIIDITPPGKPDVVGPKITNSPQPSWSWISGSSGTGNYRIVVDNRIIADDTICNTYTSGEILVEGQHIIYIQERDDAANWSASGSCTTTVDLSAAAAPMVTGSTPTNNPKPVWHWKSGGGSGSYRYKLDDSNLESGSIITNDTSFTPSADLNEGNHILYVQESDGNGNWSSSGLFVITVDNTPPAAPLLSGITPTNNTMPTWNWISGGNGSNRFRFNFTGNFTEESPVSTSRSFTAPSTLAEGIHTIYVQEIDETGNWSVSGSFSIRIDLHVPSGPVITGTTPINNKKPTWNWSSTASDGNGTYRFKLDSNTMDEGATITRATSFTPETDLTEGVHVIYLQEADTAGNWSVVQSNSITIDITPPGPPSFSPGIVTPTNDRTPTWTWMSGSGGAGKFKYKLDSGSWSDETATTIFTFSANQNAGSYSLHVQERDAAGNWSPINSKVITIDYTSPAAPLFTTSTTPSPTISQNPVWAWIHGDNTGARIYRYNIDNGSWSNETSATSYIPITTLQDGVHYFSVQERDSAMNWSMPSQRETVIIPPKPTNISVTTLNYSQLRVDWTDNAANETAYYVYYCTDNSSFNYTVSASPNATRVPLTGLNSGTTYYLKMRSIGQNNSYSDFTTVVTGKTAVAAPVISSNGSRVLVTVNITCSTPNSSVRIYYTTDGSTPTTSSTLYTQPFTVSGILRTTVKAIATLSGYTSSEISYYTIGDLLPIE